MCYLLRCNQCGRKRFTLQRCNEYRFSEDAECGRVFERGWWYCPRCKKYLKRHRQTQFWNFSTSAVEVVVGIDPNRLVYQSHA